MRRGSAIRGELLSDFRLLDDRAVTLDVVLCQIVQKIAAMTDHLKKTAAAVVVLVVCLQMLVQIVDAVGQNCDLNLGRTGVAFMGLVLLDDLLLNCLFHGFHLIKNNVLRPKTQRPVGESVL